MYTYIYTYIYVYIYIYIYINIYIMGALSLITSLSGTAGKVKCSIKNFFSKCDEIRRKLRIWSHLLKKSIMENFIFCARRITANRSEEICMFVSFAQLKELFKRKNGVHLVFCKFCTSNYLCDFCTSNIFHSLVLIYIMRLFIIRY